MVVLSSFLSSFKKKGGDLPNILTTSQTPSSPQPHKFNFPEMKGKEDITFHFKVI